MGKRCFVCEKALLKGLKVIDNGESGNVDKTKEKGDGNIRNSADGVELGSNDEDSAVGEMEIL